MFTLGARQASINDRGDIVENWFLDPASSPFPNGIAVYLFSPATGTVSPVLIPEMTPAPGGGVFHGAAAPDINDRGEIVFVASITTDNGIHLPDEPYTGIGVGVFKFSADGQITSVASPGDPLPGGGLFDSARSAATNGQGDVVFGAHVAGEPCGTFVPQSEIIHCLYDNLYIYRAATAQTELLVRTGDASIGGRNYPGGALMNNQGQIAFKAWDVQPAPVFVDDGAIYLYDGNTILGVAVPGDSMPGGGHVLQVGEYIGDHDLNNLGIVAFAASLDTDENADGFPDSGVYLWSQGSMQLVARTGTIIPGVGTVANIGHFPSELDLMWVRTNDVGHVFFSVTLTDGRGVLLLATPRQ